MKHTLSFMVWAILAILLPLQMAQAAAPPTELQKRLQNLPDISDIKPMQSDAYPEKYVFSSSYMELVQSLPSPLWLRSTLSV